MTRLFRSKSCGLVDFSPVPASRPFYRQNDNEDDGEEENDDGPDGNDDSSCNSNSSQFAILDILVTALRKSLVTCSVETEDVSAMDISWPSEVRHVSHVTFDRFNGFLGLPTELQPEVPRKVPSASASVFGVSAKSMQCSYDTRGNSVPTILLKMQKRLYMEGGLKAEGIFRINAENSQEEFVREQLNKGVVPLGIDVHCLAGLIKAWFRELPSGVLDSLTPEQVMHCDTEDDCAQLVNLLPTSEAALLDWAINLMADVAEHEQYNKMDARNIAMIFAPNMTQMVDPLNALIHAVQVMNLLKTLIMKTLLERDKCSSFSVKTRQLSGCSDPPTEDTVPSESNLNCSQSFKTSMLASESGNLATGKFLMSSTMNRLELDNQKICWSFDKKYNGAQEFRSTSGNSPPFSGIKAFDNRCKGGYENGDRLRWRKGVRRLCSRPVFQLSKPVKKTWILGL